MNVTVWDWRMDIDGTLIAEPESVVREQVREYLAGDRREFDLAVSMPDSFTGEVMAAMRDVPRGETRTYGEPAEALDTAPVAVGQACGRNPIPLVVPCHRVVAADGLGGFSGGDGDRVALKRRLLDLESR